MSAQFTIKDVEIRTKSGNYYADSITYSVYSNGIHETEFTIEDIENSAMFGLGEEIKITPTIMKLLIEYELLNFIRKNFEDYNNGN